jgi:hypothetical protein
MQMTSSVHASPASSGAKTRTGLKESPGTRVRGEESHEQK